MTRRQIADYPKLLCLSTNSCSFSLLCNNSPEIESSQIYAISNQMVLVESNSRDPKCSYEQYAKAEIEFNTLLHWLLFTPFVQ